MPALGVTVSISGLVPVAHAPTHEGGTDPVSAAGIGAETPAGAGAKVAAHAGISDGTTHGGTLINARTPTAHAASHATGQPDALAVTAIGGDAAGTARPASTVDGVAAATIAAGAAAGATASQPGHAHAGADVTSGTVDAARLPAAVTSGAAAGATASQPGHAHAGGDVTSGTVDAARLPAAVTSGAAAGATASQPGHTHAGGDVTSAVASATDADTVDGQHAAAFETSGAVTAHEGTYAHGDIATALQPGDAEAEVAAAVPAGYIVTEDGAGGLTGTDPATLPSAPANPGDDGKVWTASAGVGGWAAPAGGTSWTTILDDTFDQSRNAAALAAAGYVLNSGGVGGSPAGSTIVESATEMTVNIPAGTASDWWSGVYTGARLSYALPTREDFPADGYLVMASIEVNAVQSKFGSLMITEGANANFITNQRLYNAGNYDYHMARGVGTDLSGYVNTGSAIGWACIMILPSRMAWLGYSNNAWGSVPTMAQITWGALGYSMVNWGPAALTVHLMATSPAAAGACVMKFGRLIVRKR